MAMQTWVKVVIGTAVAGVLVLGVAIGVGVYWWRNNGREIVAQTKEASTRGADLGLTTDNEGCVAAVERSDTAQGRFRDMIFTGAFFSSCLQKSRPTPGFCKDVPPRTERLETERWQKRECPTEARGRVHCAMVLGGVQAYCHPRYERRDTSG